MKIERVPVGESHSHGAGVHLEERARDILERGLTELVRMTEGLSFKPLVSEKYPLPLASAAYASLPGPDVVRAHVRERMRDDPVSVLENALALLELYESNQPDIAGHVSADMKFINECFSSKRLNGWVCVIGDADRAQIEKAVNARWQFRFISGRSGATGVYALLNMLVRYAFIYGRIAFGDAHGLGHFVEDHTPGVIICRGKMSDLELTLSLAAMKMGVPAVVQSHYPFPLGRTIRVEKLYEVVEALVGFPNIRRLLKTPQIPGFPSYCDVQNRGEAFEPAATIGGTPRSFCILRKGKVVEPGWTVSGRPGRDIGVIITVQAEPMDAFDRRYIERHAVSGLACMAGVAAKFDREEFRIDLASGVELDPNRIGEVLIAAIRHEFPRLERIRVEVIGDETRLAEEAPKVRAEKKTRQKEIENATEETVDHFYSCVGCSPFAPDHVCCLTPERAPQCDRPYEMIKTGALYGYDDMTNIHHSKLHRDINSFQVMEKGEPIDRDKGEWTGVNAQVSRMSHGRTRRLQLHSLDEAPHTGCGCFRLIMFKTEKPRRGIAIMDRGYTGAAPDDRTWRDLHYALAGKQTPGVAGASPLYLFSRKFLRGDGGWKSVVWVTPKIAEMLGDDLPEHVEVAPAPASPPRASKS